MYDEPVDELVIENVEEEPFSIVNPSGKVLYTGTNSLILNDVRIKIIDQQRDGYVVRFNNKDYPIKRNGRIEPWPEGLCTKSTYQLAEILRKGSKIKL